MLKKVALKCSLSIYFLLSFFERSKAQPEFLSPVENPFGLSDIGGEASPTFVDIDGDGDLDAFIGEELGNVLFFENTGTKTSPVFAAPIVNPFGFTAVGSYANPTFVDIDGDGDLDVFLGESNGNTYFFENTGTKTSPVFAAPVSNPFGLTDVGDYSNPTFVDIDGDGDLDAFIGEKNGDTYFFENTGTKTAPVFAAPITNPFGLTDVDDYASPTFVDIDGDGDLDAFIGDKSGSTYFFENTGTKTSPMFATPVVNPFGLIDVVDNSRPALVDIDGDGDIDAFIGDVAGNTQFFRNFLVESKTIPTLSQWGAIVLGLLFSIFGISGLKQKEFYRNSRAKNMNP